MDAVTIATRPFNREPLVPVYILLTDRADFSKVDDDELKSFRNSMGIVRYRRLTCNAPDLEL